MRSLLFAGLLVLATAWPAAAREKKPNTLTPQEIADGWILLFDGETTFGWTIDGDAKVVDGALVLGGGRATRIVTTTAFGPEFECQFDHRGDRYLLSVEYGGELGTGGSEEWSTQRLRRWHEMNQRKTELKTKGSQAGSSVSAPPNQSTIAIRVLAGSRLELRDFKIKPLGAKPLFNGKDLTGWHAFPGKKSTFTVVDGAINVKNGPGDLQTDGKYGDFILQMECLSNGKHLNSGLFFRCRPDEYENGYEIQIRNQFTPEPTQSYTIEEYDPKTHALLGKKKIQATAVDYGTGAIYRRVPARKQTSKDGEWFTMTVVAQGNHFATWVNGVQQTDWYDNRPPSDNPRTGYRREAGHLSIQGHDPTTDLSFRNLRIAELPAPTK